MALANVHSKRWSGAVESPPGDAALRFSSGAAAPHHQRRARAGPGCLPEARTQSVISVILWQRGKLLRPRRRVRFSDAESAHGVKDGTRRAPNSDAGASRQSGD